MDKKKKLKLSDAAFYRQYDDHIILFQTVRKKAFVLTESCKRILDTFRSWFSAEELVSQLSESVSLSDEDIESVFDFISQLIADEVLIEENILSEDKTNVVSWYQNEFLPEQQLFSAQFEMTFRCNEKCRHCYCVQSNNQNELSTDEWKGIIDQLSAMNVFELTFTGGDLFVRRDTFELLEYAREKQFLINIFTNGIALSDTDILRLKKLNLKSIHFSIYSHIPERHDYFTQVHGSFQKTTDVIKKCVLIGIPVNIKSCVLNYNIEDIDGIMKLAKELGTTIQISMAVNAKNDGDTAPTAFRMECVEDYAAIMQIVNSNMELHCSNDYRQLRPDSGAICGAGIRSININPYGEVFPCNSLLMTCGNIREKSLVEIWEKSETLQAIRDFTVDKIKGCEGCPDLRYCNFCPGSALTETGDPLQRYDEACTLTRAKKLCISDF